MTIEIKNNSDNVLLLWKSSQKYELNEGFLRKASMANKYVYIMCVYIYIMCIYIYNVYIYIMCVYIWGFYIYTWGFSIYTNIIYIYMLVNVTAVHENKKSLDVKWKTTKLWARLKTKN